MTTTTRTDRTPAGTYRDHTVIGTPTHIANLLTNHSRSGTLVSVSAPRPATSNPADPRVRLTIRLRDTTTSAPVRVTRASRVDRRTRRIVALAVTAASAVAGVLTVVAYLIGVLVAFIAAHAALIVGVLVLIVVVLGLFAKVTGNSKRHCPGC